MAGESAATPICSQASTPGVVVYDGNNGAAGSGPDTRAAGGGRVTTTTQTRRCSLAQEVGEDLTSLTAGASGGLVSSQTPCVQIVRDGVCGFRFHSGGGYGGCVHVDRGR